MQNTLLLLTFDEVGTGSIRNTVFALLLGDALPEDSAGTEDTNFYNHYSAISTVESNWNLHTLGRWDVGANVFSFAVRHKCDAPKAWSSPPDFSEMLFNTGYPGPLATVSNKIWPAPDVDAVKCNRRVLPSIVETWKDAQQFTYYSDGNSVDIPDGHHPPTFGDEPEKKDDQGNEDDQKKKRYMPRRNAP